MVSPMEQEISSSKLLYSKQQLASVEEENSFPNDPRAKKSTTHVSDGWNWTLIWVPVRVYEYSEAAFFTAMVPVRVYEYLDAAFFTAMVPVRVYEYSEAAFFTAMVLNLLSFVFEETAPKRQLALLSALIKGLSWHCDTLIVGGKAVITFDAHGALLLPSRYIQWSCTTPTMLFTLSKISNLSKEEVAWTIVADVSFPQDQRFGSGRFSALPLLWWMLYMMHRMITSARNEAADNEHAKACLTFTWDSSLIIWSLFPIGWVLGRIGIPWLAAWGEPLILFSNFAAKVIFSSCILYNNFVTIAQRRLMAQLEQEHKDRVRMVEELKDTVQSKDEFISMIGHELRTPLNAIIQLSNAIARGAGGQLGDKATSWMETISSSATHLLGIINDIISIKATRSLQVHQDIVAITPIVDHVLRTLAPMAKRGVVMQKDIVAITPIVDPCVANPSTHGQAGGGHADDIL
eukprot:gene8775-33642_t